MFDPEHETESPYFPSSTAPKATPHRIVHASNQPRSIISMEAVLYLAKSQMQGKLEVSVMNLMLYANLHAAQFDENDTDYFAFNPQLGETVHFSFIGAQSIKVYIIQSTGNFYCYFS